MTRVIMPSGRISPLARLNRYLKGKEYEGARFFIFVDENSYEHCMAELLTKTDALHEAEFIELPTGEEAKTIEIVGQVWQSLMESGADRNSVIVNLGGGAVSDVGGFVAATYKRGIRYVNVPTTLLSMVDASIGGKTAINLGGAKNIVGSFYDPAAVCVDTVFLQSLPEADLRAGSVEMLKTMMVGGSIAEVPADWHSVVSDENIKDCVEIKRAVVSRDPKDHGMRKILNFGHTFGHAFEAYSVVQGAPLSHGYAVGMGMVCACYLSVRKVGLDEGVMRAVEGYVASLFEAPRYTLRDVKVLLQLMHSDKKNALGEVRCVLLQQMGAAMIDVGISDNEMRDAILSCWGHR